MSVKHYRFENLAAFYSSIAPAALTDRGIGWMGASTIECEERRYCYADAVRKVEALPEFDKPISTSRFEKRWSEYDGDTMDMPRYENGLPFLSRRMRVAGNKHGQRTARIVVNLSESWRVAASAMLWKVYSAARVVDQLETLGTRCEVFVWLGWGNCFVKRCEDYSCLVQVKNSADALNIAALSAALTPWFMRYWIVGHADTCGECCGSHGHVKDWRDDTAAQARAYIQDSAAGNLVFIIDRGECLSESSARAFVTAAAERIAAQDTAGALA